MDPADLRARILLQTPGMLVFDKPAGFETVVKGGGDPRRCLTSRLRRALKLETLEPAHRLDRDTSGCQAFALAPEALERLTRAFRERQTAKRYLALCAGVPANPSGTVRRPLSRWRGGRRPVQVARGKTGQPAETVYRVLLSEGAALGGKGVSLVEFRPVTGRTHQIRVHAAALGLPLLCDDQYGVRDLNRRVREACGLQRQALHAWMLTLPDADGTRVSLTAAPPDDLRDAFDAWLPGWRPVLGM